MRGAESVSTYAPTSEAEKFAIEYWALEEAKLQRMPKPKALATRVALVTGAGSGIGKAIATRIAAEGGGVVIADLNLEGAQALADELGGPDVAVAVKADVSSEVSVQGAIAAASMAFGGADLVVNNAGLALSKPLLETTVKDWDLQHNVMAKGSFLVSREAARVMIEQQLGGDIIYISSKNSVFAGPNNIAYSATKADQAHQVRLLAAELGQYGVRVNGINPDGVVRGSGIFAAGWGASRAAVYGVKEEDLGAYYAKRTLLGKEVLPEHIGDAVYALTAGDLSQTTGLHIPVDSGVADVLGQHLLAQQGALGVVGAEVLFLDAVHGGPGRAPAGGEDPGAADHAVGVDPVHPHPVLAELRREEPDLVGLIGLRRRVGDVVRAGEHRILAGDVDDVPAESLLDHHPGGLPGHQEGALGHHVVLQSQSFTVVSSSGLDSDRPALFTTRSAPPHAMDAAAMAPCTDTSEDTSAFTATATSGPPSSSASACAPSRLRSAMTTPPPSAAMRVAMAFPIPDPAPVTSATRVASAFGFGIRCSLASSRAQYSMANFSASLVGA